MTATATVLFCGAGGDSLGARAAGMRIVMAVNHWQTAVDVHEVHFPEAGHDCADISAADPRRYPVTDVLLASPECTNHSQARGVSRKRQDPTLWDAPDPSAERSRATMWDVPRFAEQNRYAAIVVENVVEATRWVGWRAWHVAMADLGYDHVVLSHNSMHHGVPQSRDRIYVVFWRCGLRPDLELELTAHCPKCGTARAVHQGWKNGRTIGRYRQQWHWLCTTCGTACEPATRPAADIIDWDLPCPRICDRVTKSGKPKPLAAATRRRIAAGLARYGWLTPVITAGAGHTYETTSGNRARPLTDPLAVQGTTATHAMATPPGFLVQTAHGGRLVDLDAPHPTVCANDDRHSLIIPLRRNGRPWPTDGPVPTVTAGGQHHTLVVRSYGFAGSGPLGRFTSSIDEPMPTLVTTQRPGLLMRNNGGGAEMVTPIDEPARTMTTRGHQSLLLPYYSNSHARTVDRPLPTVRTRDAHALIDIEAVIDDCGFRMLEPHEVAAAMAFPAGYIPDTLTKKARVRLAGNAVTPPVMAWIAGRVLHALETAA